MSGVVSGVVRRLEIWAPEGLPEVEEGTDLAQVVAGAVELRDGDIVVVTSKVVSKAEGRTRSGSREAAIAEETRRIVASRGPVTIVRNRLGLTMAAAGVDASNVSPGTFVLLPVDPDASAAAIRARLRVLTGVVVGVVVTDTAGRAWRLGQTDIAVGAAGLRVVEDFAGSTDAYGNTLLVTLPAVADEIAGAAELAQGKLSGRPVAVVRGRSDLVLPPDEEGAGASSLVRPEGEDLFGLGAREAVVRALAGEAEEQGPFGPAVSMADLVAVIARVPLDRTAVAAVAYAHGWVLDRWDDDGSDAVAHVSPRTP